MSDQIRGVATRFKEEPAALYVHCLAHSLNLCLQDASQSCNSVRDSLQLVMEIIKIIKFSQKRTTLFKLIKSQLSPEIQNLKLFVQQGGLSVLVPSVQSLTTMKHCLQH